MILTLGLTTCPLLGSRVDFGKVIDSHIDDLANDFGWLWIKAASVKRNHLTHD